MIEATKKLKALREQLDALQGRAQEPIAIIGAACRLPGGIDSLESYWQLLDEGRDAIEPFPPSRWNTDELYDANADAVGKTYCAQGGFVRDVDRFDAGFFGIAPREAEGMEPAQRLALECVWESLERAGIPPAELSGSLTGVYLGTVATDYEPWGGRRGMAGIDGYVFTGRDSSVLSGRVSYTLGLQGPSMTVNTACSSSLVSLHLASQALRAGECDLAFCGGSQVMITPGTFVEFSRLRGLARDGRCKSFSDDADGVIWAEGCIVLMLQRLSDAQRDGRRVLAVVRGTAVNQDGRSQGLTAPNGPAQERVIERALAESGLTSADIDAIEAHGTGTPLGDPIEAGALAAVFGPGRPADRPLYVGSAKSNFGHAQAASGAAGVLKIALALAHEKLPRSLHAERPSRRIQWDGSGLQLLQEERTWPRGPRVRRAGVSAFAISGTNAHVIIEEAPAPPTGAAAPTEATGRPAARVPLVVSAADEVALAAQAERLAEHLEHRPAASALDLAFSLATGRAALPARLALAVSADTPAAAIASTLREFASGRVPAGVHARDAGRRPGKLVMLFSGQGSQRPEMGKQLYASDAVFRDALDAVCAELDRLLPRPLREVMFAPPGSEAAQLLDQTEYTQPALFALEVALYRRWEQWGLVPDLVLGHSIGELAAAHVAGILTLADACTLVAARGRLMQRAREGGAMYAIGARDTEVAEQLFGLEDRLSIAAVNGPEQTVISGDAAEAEAVAQKLAEKGKRVHRLRVSHAFHSPHMDRILEDLREVARTLTYHPPRLPLVCNLTGAVATAERVCTPEYWVRQVRGAVRFREAIRTA
ncbi:MAG TPA: type I polyketide synthase, partial [Kofleriaceae bacterium]|nr:type I polyketide synthase [Kofleriaceae bacterium]